MKFTPTSALRFIKLSIAISGCLPCSRHAKKSAIFTYKFFRLLLILSAAGLLVPLIYSVYIYRDNVTIFPKSICLSFAVLHCMYKLVVFLNRERHFQELLNDIITFIKRDNPLEMTYLQYYINKCTFLYIIIIIGSYMATVAVCFLPLTLLGQPFPTDAVYFFSVNAAPLRQIVYMHQTFVGLQTSAGMCADNLINFILWYTATRFRVLATNFQSVKCDTDVYKCIQKHQELLRFSKLVSSAVHPVVLLNITTYTLALIFGAIYIVTSPIMMMKIQFAVVSIAVITLFFAMSWAAQSLMEASSSIGHALYSSSWTDLSTGVSKHPQKNWVQICQRSQKPVIIRIESIVPELSFPYFGSVLYQIIRYVTALKTILIT